MDKTKQISGYKIEDPNNVGEVIVSWIITHACQERCGYCISPEKTRELTSRKDHFLIQEKLINDGLTKNRYIGGEPLVIKHLPELIADAFRRGVNTRLSTNGILLTEEKFEEMRQFLNSVALPFESLDDDLNEKIRGNRLHRQIVSSRIRMIKNAGGIGLLINTCVNRENIGGLDCLGEFLSDQGVDHWKLRRFYSGSGRGAVPNKKRFEITDEEFYEVVDLLQEKYNRLRIDGRMPSKLASRLMVSPQGDLYRMVGEEEGQVITYGNLLLDNLNVKEIAKKDHCD